MALTNRCKTFWLVLTIFTALFALLIISDSAAAQTSVRVCHPELTVVPQVRSESSNEMMVCSLIGYNGKPVACGITKGGANCFYWLDANLGAIVSYSRRADLPPYVCDDSCGVTTGVILYFPVVLK